MANKNTVKELKGYALKKKKATKPTPRVKKLKAVAKVKPMPQEDTPAPIKGRLIAEHEGMLLFKSILNYAVMGNLPMDFSSLKITLVVTEESSDKRWYDRVDLYEPDKVKSAKEEIARLFYTEEEIVGKELLTLASLLEKYRNEKVIAQKIVMEETGQMSHGEEQFARSLLAGPNTIERIDKLIQKSGIVDQDNIRLLLFLAALSYKSKVPIHLGLKGNPDNVNELIRRISDFLPAEESLLIDNVSARSFHHSSDSQLTNKVLLLPNGLEKKAAQAMKSLQQNGVLTTATTRKDTLGDMVSAMKQVRTHFSSIAFQAEEENCICKIIASLDEDPVQTVRLLQYHNNKYAGLINEEEEKQAANKLRHIIYCIEPKEVVNPYAGKIMMPVRPEMIIAVNDMFHKVLTQVCLLHQHKRKKDKEGRLIAEGEDISIACNIFFGAVTFETDELGSGTSKFFTKLKAHIKEKEGDGAKEYWFTMREVRQELDIPKVSCFRAVNELHKLEYLECKGYKNIGFSYRIVYWEDTDKSRNKIKDSINRQLEKLGVPGLKSHFGTPQGSTRKASTNGVPSAA